MSTYRIFFNPERGSILITMGETHGKDESIYHNPEKVEFISMCNIQPYSGLLFLVHCIPWASPTVIEIKPLHGFFYL